MSHVPLVGVSPDMLVVAVNLELECRDPIPILTPTDIISELTGIEIPENEYVECPSMALEKGSNSSDSMVAPFSEGTVSSI